MCNRIIVCCIFRIIYVNILKCDGYFWDLASFRNSCIYACVKGQDSITNAVLSLFSAVDIH